MGVGHSNFHVFVAKQFLDGSVVIAIIEQMRGKRVAEGVTGGVLDNARLAYGILDNALNSGLVDVMASLFAGSRGDDPAVILCHTAPPCQDFFCRAPGTHSRT